MDQRPRGSSPPLYGPPAGSYSILLPSSTHVHNFQLPALPTGPANFAITGLPGIDDLSSSSSEASNDEGASLKDSSANMLSTLSWPRDEVKDAFASSVAKFEETVDSAWEWLSRPVPLCGGPPKEYDPASEEIVHEWAPPMSQYQSLTSIGSLENHRSLAAEAPVSVAPILVSFVDRSLNLMSMDPSSERPVESLTSSAPIQPVHTTCHVAAMPGDMLDFLLKEAKACEVRRLKDPSSSYTAVAKRLKETIEQHHPGTWHVFVGKDFGAHVSAEANHLAHFNVGATAFMIYKHG
ncbi:hypothetical protein FOZ62_011596 [Perkinsus olseni]|uniref:Dynein light chain n=1 Tax=Perkinsus olseni TaxID=32597 RepID=A0A7J6UFI6_PEROL|nr:hypothetical protein FOZ62_011596 [Perkinsus olseni]